MSQTGSFFQSTYLFFFLFLFILFLSILSIFAARFFIQAKQNFNAFLRLHRFFESIIFWGSYKRLIEAAFILLLPVLIFLSLVWFHCAFFKDLFQLVCYRSFLRNIVCYCSISFDSYCCCWMKEKLSFQLFVFWILETIFSECFNHLWLIKLIPGNDQVTKLMCTVPW